MIDKVEISVEEFNEYMRLKKYDEIFNNNLEDMIFMSGLPLEDIIEMKLHGYSLKDNNSDYASHIFEFNILKKEKKNKKLF